MGRRDMPTDGVEDYCIFLGQALGAKGIELNRAHVPWAERSWISALRQLSRDCIAWRGRWVLIQYTALMWSRRGFSASALIVVALLRRHGVRVAIVFHEAFGQQSGVRWIDRVRGVHARTG